MEDDSNELKNSFMSQVVMIWLQSREDCVCGDFFSTMKIESSTVHNGLRHEKPHPTNEMNMEENH